MCRYKLEEDYTISYIGDAVEFDYVIVADHKLTIKAGYVWNGCSPKLSVGGLFFIGTPDGHTDYRTGKPHTYYASLVHDALYQYEIGTKEHADNVFLLMLDHFPLRKVYFWAVRLCGRRW